MTENQKKLMKILEDMFQFDQADLDFGIYRVMAMKREEIKKFLNVDLIRQINSELEILVNARSVNEFKVINSEIDSAKSMTVSESIKTAIISELEGKKKILNSQDNISDIESDIYSHLTNFFEMYYDEGDFISQRRYKDGAYSIPYEGEEVKFHWANADQYYIKTSEYFNDYIFKVGYGNTVHFKIVSADSEKDNNKSNEKRFFQLCTKKSFEEVDKELIIYIQYKSGGKKTQKECNFEIVQALTEVIINYRDYISVLTIADGKTLLETQLNRYTARNTFDYFIHKDLGKFLNRELDLYIKNDVIFLDDIDNQDDGTTNQYLVKAKIIRKIAKKIIMFLAQIENFQKKLWLKKKFVVATNYCITLDRVPKKLYDKVICNTTQIEEWKKLFVINEINEHLSTLAYSEPLTIEFLIQNQYLVLDTVFFSDAFKEKLIDSIDNLDDTLDGLLIHSDNFQALSLLENRYKHQIQTVYIDPPYNTVYSEIAYKNNYKNSSWLSLLNNTMPMLPVFWTKDFSFGLAIDDYEFANLAQLVDSNFPNLERSVVVVNHHPQGAGGRLSRTHEYYILLSNSKSPAYLGEPLEDYQEDRSFMRSGTGDNNYRYGRWKSFYALLVNTKTNTIVNVEDPVPLGEPYPTELTEDGLLRIYPINSKGEERVWRSSYLTGRERIKNGELTITTSGTIYQTIDHVAKRELLFSNWVDPKFNAGIQGSNLLRNMGLGGEFDYPKSIKTLETGLWAQTFGMNDVTVLDFFAGSGTTGHAVINLNRKDNGNRKYILVEMGEYVDTITKLRIEKAIYSDSWKDGKPVSRNGSSHAFKYIYLESYEDTLNNLQLKDNDIGFLGDVTEQYMINYMLDIETKGSDSLINIDKFKKPFDYSMNITMKLKSTVCKLDLVETFNYLIGLKVERNYALQTLDADFIKGEYGAVTATIKEGCTYKIKMIEGRTLTGDSILIIWRELTGDRIKDNAVLDAFFVKKKISTIDFEYKKIYVNGDNNLTNLKAENEEWKVLLIEEEMKKRMFDNIN